MNSSSSHHRSRTTGTIIRSKSSAPQLTVAGRNALGIGLSSRPKTRPSNHLRRSITDADIAFPPSYQTAFPNASATELMSPPMYDEISEFPLPKARFKVLPRAEEGREILPGYSCSLRRECIVDRKLELDSPFEKATDRSWTRVYAVLNNTVISFHKPKKANSIFGSSSKASLEDPTDKTACVAGALIKSYTLQHAEVGAATDYKKRPYAIRVRAETQQFLLSFTTPELFFEWLEALSSGIDLALPLEERSLPQHQTIPRRRRRRRARDMVQQQEEIIRRHFPQLLETAADEAPPAPRAAIAGSTESLSGSGGDRALEDVEESANVDDIEDSTAHDEELAIALNNFHSLGLITPINTSVRRQSLARSITAPAAFGPSSPLSPLSLTSTISESHAPIASLSMREHLVAAVTRQTPPQTDENGKWLGCSNVSHEANLRFAKRCMAVLTAEAPRQSQFVMHRGVRYKLLPDARDMIPDTSISLPAYESARSGIISSRS